MNRRIGWGFALALLPLAACSDNHPPEAAAPPSAPPPPALSQADTTFMQQAAASDAFEIQSSQLAAAQARRPAVKRFAQEMIQDHGQTTQQLTQIAQSKNVPPPPAQPDAEHAQMISALQGEHGGRFDRDYLRDQVSGHEMAATAYQQEISTGTDADLKAFAQQTLPIIQRHLQEARSLSGMRGGHTGTNPAGTLPPGDH